MTVEPIQNLSYVARMDNEYEIITIYEINLV